MAYKTGMYSAIGRTFSELNNLMINHQRNMAAMESESKKFALQSEIQKEQIKDQLQQREIRQAQLDEINYQKEVIPIRPSDVGYDPTDDNYKNLLMKRNDGQDWVRNFLTPIKDPNTGELVYPNARVDFDRDIIEVQDSRTGQWSPLQMQRRRADEKMIGHIFGMSAAYDVDEDVVFGIVQANNDLNSVNDELRRFDPNNKVDYINPRYHELKRSKVAIQKQLDNANALKKKLNKGTDFRKVALYSQEKFLKGLYGRLSSLGLNTKQVDDTFNTQMNRIAKLRAAENNQDTALERGYQRYLKAFTPTVEQPQPMEIWEFKNTIWEPNDSDSDFKMYVKEARAINPKRTLKDIRTEYLNLKEQQERDLTPNVAIKSMESLWYELPPEIQNEIANKYSFADAAKAVQERAKIPGVSREDALYQIYGEIRSGNYKSLEAAATGRPDPEVVKYQKAEKARKQAVEWTKKTPEQKESAIVELSTKLSNSFPDAPLGTKKRHNASGTTLIKVKDNKWVPLTSAEAKLFLDHQKAKEEGTIGADFYQPLPAGRTQKGEDFIKKHSLR